MKYNYVQLIEAFRASSVLHRGLSIKGTGYRNIRFIDKDECPNLAKLLTIVCPGEKSVNLMFLLRMNSIGLYTTSLR